MFVDAAHRRETWTALDALLQKAEPGTILVDASSAEFLKRRFELEPAGVVPGQVEAAYRLAVASAGFEVGGVTQSVRRRERELSMLYEVLTRVEEGSGRVVGILGEPEPEVTLLHEFRQSLDRGRVTYLEGRCLLRQQ